VGEEGGSGGKGGCGRKGGEMTQTLYARMNKRNFKNSVCVFVCVCVCVRERERERERGACSSQYLKILLFGRS
jgi:hypothetical protein